MICDGINVRYIYSACIVTSTRDVVILHDPWFTEGIYDGSWFHFPIVENPIESIGDVDYIYISHIHPDHYDSNFLKQYFKQYGVKNILIANHTPNHLANKMKADGFEYTILKEKMEIGNTAIKILPHCTGSISDVDSVIEIKYFSENDRRIHCVVNTNDVIFDQKMCDIVKSSAGDIDILLCGFTGAGPYPQTYFDTTDPAIFDEASAKKYSFFNRYKNLISIMQAKVNVPFAGKYVLGGRLASLNAFRGVADPVEILGIDDRAVVLADIEGEISTLDLKPSKVRVAAYDNAELVMRLSEISSYQMDYEKLFAQSEIQQLPIKRLLVSAAKNAITKSECMKDYFFCIGILNGEFAIINANKNGDKLIQFADNYTELPGPYSLIDIDPRYLFGLLTHIYHWNNAEVGSQYQTRRFPNLLVREAQSFLNYLAI